MPAEAGLNAQATSEGTQEIPSQPAPMGTPLPIEPKAVGQLAYRAPLCKGHQEPCVRKRVNKSGPNKGLLAVTTTCCKHVLGHSKCTMAYAARLGGCCTIRMRSLVNVAADP